MKELKNNLSTLRSSTSHAVKNWLDASGVDNPIYNQQLIDELRNYPLTPEEAFPPSAKLVAEAESKIAGPPSYNGFFVDINRIGSDWDIDRYKHYMDALGIDIFNSNSVSVKVNIPVIGTYPRRWLLLL